jgi:hypothetical protein
LVEAAMVSWKSWYSAVTVALLLPVPWNSAGVPVCPIVIVVVAGYADVMSSVASITSEPVGMLVTLDVVPVADGMAKRIT